MDKATVEAAKALRNLLDAQRPLDADAERLLREHLWELYDDRALASPDDYVRVPRETLEGWAEHWNGNHNIGAMLDALEYIINEIENLLAAAPGEAPQRAERGKR